MELASIHADYRFLLLDCFGCILWRPIDSQREVVANGDRFFLIACLNPCIQMSVVYQKALLSWNLLTCSKDDAVT